LLFPVVGHLSQSFGDTFFELVMVEYPRIAVGISTLSIIVPEKYILPVWAAILLFPVVGRSRNHFICTRHGRKLQGAVGRNKRAYFL